MINISINEAFMDFPLLIEAKNLILKYLNQLGVKPTENTTQKVLESYFNLKHKFIKNQPRSVLVSDGLASKAKTLNVEFVLEIIHRKFLTGEDINPFLSKGIVKVDKHDHLLNDWEIHHLHLNESKSKSTDYFNDRSHLLLFVHITVDSVYFIDIRHHNENYVFAQRDLLRIVRDNWPDLNKKFLIKDEEMEIWPKLDEDDIHTLRKKGYSFWTQVDKHVYAPGLGSATSGFSLKAGMGMNEFHRQLYKTQSYIWEHEKELIDTLSKSSGITISTLHFSLIFEDWLFYVYEANSKLFVNFNLTGYEPLAAT